jgi:hypothetical protein
MIEHKALFVRPQLSVVRPILNETIGLFGVWCTIMYGIGDLMYELHEEKQL